MQIEEMVAWLEKVWDQDEAVADQLMVTLGCSPARWFRGDKIPGTDQQLIIAEWTRADGKVSRESIGIADREYLLNLTHRDPESALARTAAERALLAAYREAIEYYGQHQSAPAGEVTGLETALKIIASGYAARSGYDEGWRP